jgi:hypothetical protein
MTFSLAKTKQLVMSLWKRTYDALLGVSSVWILITLSTLIEVTSLMNKSKEPSTGLSERLGYFCTIILALSTLPFCLTVYAIWLVVAGAVGSCSIIYRFWSRALIKVMSAGQSIKQ